jgi:hypothetical protein
MNTDLNNWLAQKADLPSVVAAGIIHTDRTAFSQTLSDKLSAPSLDKIWPAIAEVVDSSKQQRFPTGRWTWSFENFSIHCSVRTDGACLATVTSRKVSALHMEALDNLLAEFRRL